MLSEALFNPKNPDDIDAAYKAKEAMDCIDADINKIKDEREKKEIEKLLSEYINLCEQYTETINAVELIKEHQPKDLENCLLNLEKQRRVLHDKIKEALKKITKIIINNNGCKGKWIDYIKNNSLSRNREKISWLAICTAKWKRLQDELNKISANEQPTMH